jgi:Arc/MetJ family transcription regulator
MSELQATFEPDSCRSILVRLSKKESMKTSIDIDDRLLQQAMRLSGKRTKKATVEAALQLLVRTDVQGDFRKLGGNLRRQGIYGQGTTSSHAEKNR